MIGGLAPKRWGWRLHDSRHTSEALSNIPNLSSAQPWAYHLASLASFLSYKTAALLH